MRRQEEQIEALGLKVVVVTFELGPMAQAYARETELRWPLLVDESRATYAAYNMERGHWWDIYGPAAWWVYAKLLAKGQRLQHTEGDVDQLGGDILIDPAGIVQVHHVGAGPADRPTVESLLNRVRDSS